MIKKERGSEFRRDLVSGDWILISSERKKRPHFFDATKKSSKKSCPFDDPQGSGNPSPLLWYPKPGTPAKERDNISSWFIQVIPNKYPVLPLPLSGPCPIVEALGPQKTLKGLGFHEVIITRDHKKPIDKMTIDEVNLLLKAYQVRYQTLVNEPCVNYILIFHNHGELAGASVSHPHSQLVAIPVVDSDISRSLAGSRDFYDKNNKCVHCVMLDWERQQKDRIIYQNEYFVTLAPFASRVPYETRIYPLAHGAHFEEISDEKRHFLADALRDAIKRMNKALENPDYNFFIHSAPHDSHGGEDRNKHYHWHIEIFPRGYKWAGLELGVGIEVVSVPPEEAAENLRNVES